jgi:hypothetical protein
MTIAKAVVCVRKNAHAEPSIWSKKSDSANEKVQNTVKEEVGKAVKKMLMVNIP